MKIIATLMVSLGLAFSAFAGQKDGAKKSTQNLEKSSEFGAKLVKSDVTTLGNVMAEYKKYEGKVVTLEATPTKVCKKSGCWMVLKDGDQQVRTMFKDYGFFVPANIQGKKVRVQGRMEKKMVSAGTIRHLMKDEGKSREEIKKIKTGQIRFQFVADGVEII